MMNYENELVLHAKNGDANALNLLLDQNKSYVYAIAFALLKNHEDADDAVQKTMITVWQSIGTLENPKAFRSWLYRIAHTRSLNVLQSKKNNRFISDEDISEMPQLENMESELMLPQVYAERDDLRDRLYRILDGLSAVQRETIVLYYFNDRSVAEIAEIMDCSENTVKSRLYLARHSIKTEIEELERKSGEKFYGIAVGVLPIGYFVAEHVKHSLPSAEVLGNLVTKAQQAENGVAPQVAAKAVAKGVPTAVKALLVTLGIATAALAGLATAKLVSDGQKKDNSASTETQAVFKTDAPAEKPTKAPAEPLTAVPAKAPAEPSTAAPTEAPTEAPTKSPYHDAYRAFHAQLQQHGSDILAYTWQYKTDTPQPVVFADIMGDDTPEMIFAYSQNDMANVKVFTYNGFVAVEALDYKLLDNNKVMHGRMFVSQIDGALYIFECTAPGAASFETAFRCEESGSNSLHPVEVVKYNPRTDLQNTETGQSRINGSVVSPAEAKEAYQTLAESTDALLMSSSDFQGNSYPRTLGLDTNRYPNQSMTFDKAIAFLNNATNNN